MDTVKGGVAIGAAHGSTPAATTGKSVMDGNGQPAGWDPFEVWRTRVRDVHQKRSREATSVRKR